MEKGQRIKNYLTLTLAMSKIWGHPIFFFLSDISLKAFSKWSLTGLYLSEIERAFSISLISSSEVKGVT